MRMFPGLQIEPASQLQHSNNPGLHRWWHSQSPFGCFSGDRWETDSSENLYTILFPAILCLFQLEMILLASVHCLSLILSFQSVSILINSWWLFHPLWWSSHNSIFSLSVPLYHLLHLDPGIYLYRPTVCPICLTQLGPINYPICLILFWTTVTTQSELTVIAPILDAMKCIARSLWLWLVPSEVHGYR